MVAALIDIPLSMLAAFVVLIVAATAVATFTALVGLRSNPDAPGITTAFQVIALASIVYYFAGFESSRFQATPGKLIVGLRVTDLDGARIGLGRATKQYLLKYLSAIPVGIGFIRIIVSENRQAFHDSESGTLVLLSSSHRPRARRTVGTTHD